ncbi:MAG: glycosyltransferase family 39 protein [Deltaproteobacteria bacterium]|nr:glycosyltransferase family 39 protein [Deltaproteobacteria bacterium]
MDPFKSPLGRRTSIILPIIIGIGFLLRLSILIHNWGYPNILMQVDSWGYHHIAENLLLGNGYSWSEEAPFVVNVYRPPGLPVILLGVYFLFGVSIPHAILLQSLVSTAVIWMTFCVTRTIFGRRIALIAASLQAIDPLSISYSNLLMTELFSSFALISAAYILMKYLAKPAAWHLPLMGLLFGGAILIHPICLFLPLFILPMPLFTSRTRSFSQFSAAFVAVLIGLAPAAMWSMRNWTVADYPGFSSAIAASMLKYKAAGILSELHGTDLLTEANILARECEASLPPNATRGDRWLSWQEKGRSIVINHPFIFAKINIKGAFTVFFGPGRANLAQQIYGGKRMLDTNAQLTDESYRSALNDSPVFMLNVIRYMALSIQGMTYILFVLGLTRLLIIRKFLITLMLTFPILYVLALSSGPEAFCRFRVIFMPFISIIASLGAGFLWNSFRAKWLNANG